MWKIKVQMKKLQLKPALLHPKEMFVTPQKNLHNWQKWKL